MRRNLFEERNSENEIAIEKNEFIKRLILPIGYWYFNMSVKNIQKSILDENTNTDLQKNKNNIFELKLDYIKKENESEIPFFMRPRKDWHIGQGDYIVEEKKEIKRKLITKQDWDNFKSGFWYLLISGLVTYFILHSISKLS